MRQVRFGSPLTRPRPDGARRPRNERWFALPAIAAALTLSACGFTPLYATPGVSSGLSSIQVIAPEGRMGYLLREQLDDALAHRPGETPTYRLRIVLDQTRTPLGLRIDDVADRYQVSLAVEYILTDAVTGAEVTRGSAASFLSYDVAQQPYAAIAARQDVQERAATEVARKIQMDLAQWFAARARLGG
jgi:LPS-assembly lipoprotein